jgi:putative PIN family toxin of toxin-antitoxin system
MIRVVFDTNLYVSAFFWGGPPRRALDLARSGTFQIVASVALVDELLEVISRSKFTKHFTAIYETPESLLNHEFRGLVEMVEPAEISSAVVDDADDDPVLACALGGKADYIVSGDSHLLNLGEYHTIPILTIARLLSLLNSDE